MRDKIYNSVSTLLLRASHNRVAKNTVYSVVGFVVPLLTTLFLTPPLIRRLGEEGYGLWSVALSALGVMGILEFGLGAALAKYIAEYYANQDWDGLSSIITAGFLLNFGIGFLLTLPLYFLAPQIASFFKASTLTHEQIADAIKMVSFGFMPLLLRNVGLAVPKGLQRFDLSASLHAIQNVMTIVVALIVALVFTSIKSVVLSTVILMWIFSFVSLIIAYRLSRSVHVHFALSSSQLRKMLSFMMFAGLRGLGGQLFRSMDRLVVGTVLGLSEVTYYTVAIGIANKFISLSAALTQSLMPAASSWNATGDVKRLWKYFSRATFGLVILNFSAGIVLIALAGPFLRIWLGEDFASQALVPFRILILVCSVVSLTAPAAEMADGMGVPWINTIGALSAGVGTIALIALWGPRWGLIGAAWANAASWIKFIAPAYVGYHLLRRKRQEISLSETLS